jgi:uncharacterized protein YjbJ (UPF0337 family)
VSWGCPWGGRIGRGEAGGEVSLPHAAWRDVAEVLVSASPRAGTRAWLAAGAGSGDRCRPSRRGIADRAHTWSVGEQTRGERVFKSARRNKTEGAVDRLAGRVLEVVGKVTGRKSHKAKGKAARARGSTRKKRGQAKKTARR